MIIDIKSLLDISGEKQELKCEIMPTADRLSSFGILAPLKLEIALLNRATVLGLEYKVRFNQRCICDRCLKEELKENEMTFSHTLVRSLNGTESEGYLLVPDDRLNIAVVAEEDILLELPKWYLCREDCKGICPMCGVDLNCSSCGCKQDNSDPRLEILKKLL